MKLDNQDFFRESALNHYYYFLDDLDNMITLTYQICSDAKTPDNLAASLLFNRLSRSPYYYKDAIKAISSYQTTGHHALVGVLYPNQDLLITSSYTYTVSSYIKDKLNIYDPEMVGEISSFLQGDFNGRTEMHSLSTHSGSSEALLVTVSTYIGPQKTPVVFLYRLDEISIQTALLSSDRYESLQFAIFDGNTHDPLLLPYPSSIDFTSLVIDWDSVRSGSSDPVSVKQNSQEYSLYLTYNKTYDFNYVVIGSYNDIYKTSIQYFKAMQLIAFISIGILFVMLLFLVYINYKPINTLTQKLPKHSKLTGTTSNIFDLSSAIDDIMDELNETNMLLKDYLLENILIGNPVNKLLIDRLDIANYDKYQVHALSTICLNTQERITLTDELQEQFGMLSFIIDITQIDITVIVCLMPQNDQPNHTEYLEAWINQHYPGTFLYNGCIVDSIDDLQHSFLSCNIPKLNEKQKKEDSNTKSLQLANEILQYLQENYCDPNLSQSLVADQFNISIYTLSRLFKNQFGIGFAEFISSKRIESAKQLLLTTNAPIGEIAKSVGIPNLNYFSRLFKATQGISPTQFRNNTTTDL